MEKHNCHVPNQPQRRPVRSREILIAAAAIAALVFTTILNIRQFSVNPKLWDHPTPKPKDPWNPWDEITPSTELRWTPCYQFVDPTFQCARLSVPLDYDQPLRLDGQQVHIALVLIPSKNSSLAKSPLIINPGGPGGSGVLAGLGLGGALQTVLGDDQPIIGFDPRGIAYTTPGADCWSTPPACDGCPEDELRGFSHRVEWITQNSVFGGVNSSNVALKFLDAGSRAVNDLCRAKDAYHNKTSILRHASTAHVARDMLSIVDAWDRWTDSLGVETSENPTRGKLVYWGFSYGTFLGSTFASMFPDRVGRLLLDGVVDADFYISDMWDESLADADRVLDRFFVYCAEAKQACALFREGDTPSAIRQRYDQIIARLEAYPITFTHPEHFFPVILRPELIHRLVFSILYSPIVGFPPLATLLNFLYEERYTEFGPLFTDLQVICALPSGTMLNMGYDAQRAIMCSDKLKPVNLSLEQIREHFDTMSAFSGFADIWTELMLACNGWDIYAHPPPQSSPLLDREKQIKTSFPILFLSNTYDPVTPLRAAVKMALRFKDAGLVEQKAEGHCTIAAVSRCTAKIIRDYVIHGTVPPAPVLDGDDYLHGEWTTCEADERPWKRASQAGQEGEAQTAEEKELVRAFETVRDVLVAIPPWAAGLSSDDVGAQTERVLKRLRSGPFLPL